MTELFEIKKSLIKVLRAFHDNRDLMEFPKTSGYYNRLITPENLSDVAANHFFDDYPEKFGISEKEGHMIRAYFQERDERRYVIELCDDEDIGSLLEFF